MCKKKFTYFIFYLFILLAGTKGSAQESIKDGFYYLAENSDDAILINQYNTNNVFGIEKNPALDLLDFKKLKISTVNFEPKAIKSILVSLSIFGKKKWFAIQNRCFKSKESIVFVFENKIYSQFFFNTNNSVTESIYLCLEQNIITGVFDKINSKMNNNKITN